MKIKKVLLTLIFSVFCFGQFGFSCRADVSLSITPEEISEKCKNNLVNLGAQFGKCNLKIYCPLSETQILIDSERLYKVVSKFLDDNKDVDPSKFDDFCRLNCVAGDHRNPNFDGKIKVVSADEFKKYVNDPNYVQLYRGAYSGDSADLRAGNIAKNVKGAIRGVYYGGDGGATSGNGMLLLV